jgi:hypothetical protein
LVPKAAISLLLLLVLLRVLVVQELSWLVLVMSSRCSRVLLCTSP